MAKLPAVVDGARARGVLQQHMRTRGGATRLRGYVMIT